MDRDIHDRSIGRHRISRCAAAAFFFLSTAIPSFAAGSCPPAPAGASDSIQSTDIENRFGPVFPAEKPVNIIYVAQVLVDPFWGEVIAGMEAEAKRLNVKLKIVAPKDRFSLAEQLTVAKAALAEHPDVLILTAMNATNLRAVVDEANTAGTPTVSINLKADAVKVHIGTSHVALGAAGAEFLHENLPGGGTVAQIEGESASPYRIDRVKGFKDTLKVYSNLHLAASAPADWDTDKAYALTLDFMAKNPEIKGIYTNADVMAFGAVKALEKIGRQNDVVVIGTDGVKVAKDMIQAGKMNATAAQFPGKEGALGIQIGLRLLACQTIPPWVVSPQAILTKKNVADYAAGH